MISMPKLWDNKREILCTNAYLAYYYEQFRWFTICICIWAYAAFFKWKEVYSSNIHHYSMHERPGPAGLWGCPDERPWSCVVPPCHMLHLVQWRCFLRFFVFTTIKIYVCDDEEFHPFKSCVLRKLYNPPKLYLMIS